LLIDYYRRSRHAGELGEIIKRVGKKPIKGVPRKSGAQAYKEKCAEAWGLKKKAKESKMAVVEEEDEDEEMEEENEDEEMEEENEDEEMEEGNVDEDDDLFVQPADHRPGPPKGGNNDGDDDDEEPGMGGGKGGLMGAGQAVMV